MEESRSLWAGLVLLPVGTGAPNNVEDVRTVQRLLQLAGTRARPAGGLIADGVWGPRTEAALRAFQERTPGLGAAEGCLTPGGRTLHALMALLPPPLAQSAHLRLVFVHARDADLQTLGPAVLACMRARNIDSPLRQAHFLAQVGHESAELRHREELASGREYEGRLQLGNTERGDGPRFKGRGLIQLTGRANYAAYGRSLGRERDLLEQPECVAREPELCVDVAGWFWETRGLNALADADDLARVTRRINGGLHGLEDRSRLLRRAKAALRVGCA
ncbi:glycoside hydrolase family 19 protein [Megalodesulfovibrio paquesii]